MDQKVECKYEASGKMRVYVLASKKNEEYDKPILIIPGWGESAESAMGMAQELSKSNNTIFIVDYGNLDNTKIDSDCSVDKSFPITERARACAVLDLLSREDRKMSIVAHSQGAIAAMLTGTLQPEMIEKIILIAPAGIVSSNLLPLTIRYIKSYYSQLAYVLTADISFGKKYFEMVSKYTWRNPIQLTRDAYGITKSNIVPLIKTAKELKIDVTIICSKNDRLFSVNKIKERIKSTAPIVTLDGNHDELFFQPSIFAKQILSIINGKI